MNGNNKSFCLIEVLNKTMRHCGVCSSSNKKTLDAESSSGVKLDLKLD